MVTQWLRNCQRRSIGARLSVELLVDKCLALVIYAAMVVDLLVTF